MMEKNMNMEKDNRSFSNKKVKAKWKYMLDASQKVHV